MTSAVAHLDGLLSEGQTVREVNLVIMKRRKLNFQFVAFRVVLAWCDCCYGGERPCCVARLVLEMAEIVNNALVGFI